MRNIFLFLMIFLSISVVPCHAQQALRQGEDDQIAPRNIRDLKAAEKIILLTIAHGEENNYKKMEEPWLSPLAFSLPTLAAANSKVALSSLANLIRYNLGPDLAEMYACYVAQKQNRMVPSLKTIDPDRLVKQCKIEFLEIKKENDKKLKDISDVCHDKETIKFHIRRLLSVIKEKKLCAGNGF